VSTSADRRLLDREQVVHLLHIPDEDLQALIDTNQVVELVIRGHKRYDSADVFALVDTYKQLTRRRNQPHDRYQQ
jgi:diadenosine tetraphosphatase ApaH/serine/threonine PP2A family protein phosphatase